jgi:hypothetical protein
MHEPRNVFVIDMRPRFLLTNCTEITLRVQ